jgi:hypothetical protein
MGDVIEDAPEWDPWGALGVPNGGYCSEIDGHGLAIFEKIRSGIAAGGYVTDIVGALGLEPHYVELWQYIFCSAGWADYGTSPRGCFVVDNEAADTRIAQWRDYMARTWAEGGDE